MKNVFNMVNDFIKGLSGVLVGNITTLLGTFLNGGFIGLVALVMIASFFTDRK